jgi:hypothetical protein
MRLLLLLPMLLLLLQPRAPSPLLVLPMEQRPPGLEKPCQLQI